MKRATREWVRKAEKDWRAAQELVAAAGLLHDQVCFFCQQVAEKYLKALLEELSQPIPKTHDLVRLLNDVVVTHSSLKRHRRRLRSLTKFAVATRYPGDNATKRQSERAMQWIEEIRQDCRVLLKIKPSAGGPSGP